MTDQCGTPRPPEEFDPSAVARPMLDSCREVLEELDLFLDNECGDDLAASVRRHLGHCPPCMDRADFERALRELIASKCRDAAPSGLVDRIIDSLKPASPPA
ncbi:MAG TPA: mycothiol system anti-sigma-R factor [Egibacteraceae bacterium]|nr:mycothiol system anti-sigma-R factor [Egibacteraceae bacterium]